MTINSGAGALADDVHLLADSLSRALPPMLAQRVPSPKIEAPLSSAETSWPRRRPLTKPPAESRTISPTLHSLHINTLTYHNIPHIVASGWHYSCENRYVRSSSISPGLGTHTATRAILARRAR